MSDKRATLTRAGWQTHNRMSSRIIGNWCEIKLQPTVGGWMLRGHAHATDISAHFRTQRDRFVCCKRAARTPPTSDDEFARRFGDACSSLENLPQMRTSPVSVWEDDYTSFANGFAQSSNFVGLCGFVTCFWCFFDSGEHTPVRQ